MDKSGVQNILFKTISLFAKHMLTVVLPHILGSMALAVLGIFCVYKFAFLPSGSHGAAQVVITLVLCVIYLPLAFIYGLFLAGLSTLRAVAGATEDIIEDFLARLKKHTETKVESMREGVTKKQAKILLTAGIKDVAAEYQANKAAGAGRALAVFLLSFVVWAARGVLFSKIKNAGGGKISFGLLFAGPQALAAAAVMNLEFTATFLLVLGYIFGLMMLGLMFLFIIL